jgi:hypothetical protein
MAILAILISAGITAGVHWTAAIVLALLSCWL